MQVPGAVFADQFENLANLRAHLDTGAHAEAQPRTCRCIARTAQAPSAACQRGMPCMRAQHIQSMNMLCPCWLQHQTL
jgi:hypothetical protein